MRRVVLVTGLQAAGKSTVGRLLAQRLDPPAAAFDGDVLFDMVLAGKAVMTPDPTDEAVRQLNLRYRGAALLAQHYVDNGFDFVYSDILMGAGVTAWLDSIRDARRHLVVLRPSVEAVAERERGRGSNFYDGWRTGSDPLEAAITAMAEELDRTPRRGQWLDTSDESPEQTVSRILADDLRASRY